MHARYRGASNSRRRQPGTHGRGVPASLRAPPVHRGRRSPTGRQFPRGRGSRSGPACLPADRCNRRARAAGIRREPARAADNSVARACTALHRSARVDCNRPPRASTLAGTTRAPASCRPRARRARRYTRASGGSRRPCIENPSPPRRSSTPSASARGARSAAGAGSNGPRTRKRIPPDSPPHSSRAASPGTSRHTRSAPAGRGCRNVSKRPRPGPGLPTTPASAGLAAPCHPGGPGSAHGPMAEPRAGYLRDTALAEG
jgi:hypothetical protein